MAYSCGGDNPMLRSGATVTRVIGPDLYEVTWDNGFRWDRKKTSDEIVHKDSTTSLSPKMDMHPARQGQGYDNIRGREPDSPQGGVGTDEENQSSPAPRAAAGDGRGGFGRTHAPAGDGRGGFGRKHPPTLNPNVNRRTGAGWERGGFRGHPRFQGAPPMFGHSIPPVVINNSHYSQVNVHPNTVHAHPPPAYARIQDLENQLAVAMRVIETNKRARQQSRAKNRGNLRKANKKRELAEAIQRKLEAANQDLENQLKQARADLASERTKVQRLERQHDTIAQTYNAVISAPGWTLRGSQIIFWGLSNEIQQRRIRIT